MAVGVQQQQRRDTEANWVTSGKVLAQGEIGYATDSHIIKMGDGVNTWDDLTIPYDGRYLPIGGTAANSEMLDGISSGGFILVGDASTIATADKIAKRDGAGRMKAVAGAESDDVVNFAQLTSAIVSRAVSAAATLALTDVGKTIIVNNSSYTPAIVLNVPANATVPIPIGSFVDVYTGDKGPVALTPAGGVTIFGPTLLYGAASELRLVKTDTNGWIVQTITRSPGPVLRRKIKTGSDNTVTATFSRFRLDGADSGTALFSNNVDTLGAGEQYNSSTDLYRCYCRRSGWYDVMSQFSIGDAGTGRAFIQLRVNNIEQHFGAGIPRAGQSEMSMGFSDLIPLNVGDYVEVWGYQDGGGTPSVSESPYASSFLSWAWNRPL